MAKIELQTLLGLVGELNDSDQPNSASVRFRQYLAENVYYAEDLQDYIEDALKASGDQFNKALQDLINHLGQCLGFEVTYGRYRGVKEQIGFDGLWRSPMGPAIVIETKTTDAYTIKTATLLGYINALVSEGQIDRPNDALGIYVYGRFDVQAGQLENAITAEGRRERLRVVGVDALLNLLALKQEYGLVHRTVLGLLLPAPVRIDPLINLISDIVAQEKEEGDIELETESQAGKSKKPPITSAEPVVDKEDRVTLASIDEDYTGQSAVAFIFKGERYEVHTWKEIAVTLFQILWEHDQQGFEEAAKLVRGRKRPYFTQDKSELRQSQLIPGSDLFFEANLSANYVVKLCKTVLEQTGLGRSALIIEAEF
jgi:hypothetical protein